MIELTHVATLAHKELRDSRKNRWFLLYVVALAGLSVALTWLGLSGLGSYRVSGFGRTAASLINVLLLVVPLMGLTLGANSLSSERQRGTLLYLLSQPITAFELWAGKFLGLAVALLAALVIGFGLSGLAVGWKLGSAQSGSYLALLGLAFLLAVACLSVGYLISAVSGNPAAALGIALFIWLGLVFFGDLGLMGTALVLKLPIGQVFGLALLNPLQVFKMAAIIAMQGNLDVLGPAGLYAARQYGMQLLPILLAILALWTAVPLSLSYVVFRRKGAL